ncbi:hypothetical protein IC235_12050 [Hymenobacter sp. BT664]|uniref:Uncharacterized protein n=1 Tax=Hymenobacter montanus TaxID=2771359 RepID=A0A927BD54_9BACT|nr:hypothetical protein [Hymenobacter montanus]
MDKYWDGIIFLLTGRNFGATNYPLVKISFSRQLIA